MKGASRKLAKAFGALRPKTRNSGKQQPDSLSSGSLPPPPTTLPNAFTTSTHPQAEATKRSGDDDRTMSSYAAAAKGLRAFGGVGKVSHLPVLKRKVIIAENSSQLEDELEKTLNEWKAASEDQDFGQVQSVW
jgi:hypothetical protein